MEHPPLFYNIVCRFVQRLRRTFYNVRVHFGLSAFTVNQFGRIAAPGTAYAPTDLDARQWAGTAEEAGGKTFLRSDNTRQSMGGSRR